MIYEELLMEADNNNLITKEKPLHANKGRIKGNRIAIKKDLTETEKKCVLAEEFFIEALQYYHSKYGTSTTIDNYLICFEPLGVLELYG